MKFKKQKIIYKVLLIFRIGISTRVKNSLFTCPPNPTDAMLHIFRNFFQLYMEASFKAQKRCVVPLAKLNPLILYVAKFRTDFNLELEPKARS